MFGLLPQLIYVGPSYGFLGIIGFDENHTEIYEMEYVIQDRHNFIENVCHIWNNYPSSYIKIVIRWNSDLKSDAIFYMNTVLTIIIIKLLVVYALVYGFKLKLGWLIYIANFLLFFAVIVNVVAFSYSFDSLVAGNSYNTKGSIKVDHVYYQIDRFDNQRELFNNIVWHNDYYRNYKFDTCVQQSNFDPYVITNMMFMILSACLFIISFIQKCVNYRRNSYENVD